MFKKYFLNEISAIKIDIFPGDIIFLYGDLAAWKTTLAKHIINNLLGVKSNITSPTYSYYNKYEKNIYHFDLYRLLNYDEFFAIGWEEILENSQNISIIEWPEIITPYFKPTLKIYLEKTNNDLQRKIMIQRI